jgi:branched-chain amino acid transport system substrate-binding protein
MGVITPLSGIAAPWGIPHLRGFELAFEIINERGGVVVDGKRYYFEAVGYDNKYSEAETVAVARKLIFDDQIDYVSVLIQVAPIRDLCREEGVLMINLSWTYEAINPDYPLMFHYLQMAQQTQAVLTRWIAENTFVERSVGFGPDIHVGYMGQEIDRRAAEYYGIEKVDTIYFDPTATEFSADLTKVLELNPDYIALNGTPATQVALIIKQARELGYEGLIGNEGDGAAGLPAMADVAGAENMEGYIAWGPTGLEETEYWTPAMQDWKVRYLQKYGEYEPTSIDWSMGAFSLADGIQHANSLDPADIAAALRAPDFEGTNLYGTYSYGGEELWGIACQVLAPIAFYQWKEDGKAHNVAFSYPEEYMPIAVDMGMAGIYK